MFENLEILKMSHAMARHAGRHQGLIAANVANADTPGYRAQGLPDFATSYDQAQGGFALRTTRPGHFAEDGSGLGAAAVAAIERASQASPNGNTVSLEDEMTQAAAVRQQHDMALGIYSSARDILRASLGRGR